MLKESLVTTLYTYLTDSLNVCYGCLPFKQVSYYMFAIIISQSKLSKQQPFKDYRHAWSWSFPIFTDIYFKKCRDSHLVCQQYNQMMIPNRAKQQTCVSLQEYSSLRNHPILLTGFSGPQLLKISLEVSLKVDSLKKSYPRATSSDVFGL